MMDMLAAEDQPQVEASQASLSTHGDGLSVGWTPRQSAQGARDRSAHRAAAADQTRRIEETSPTDYDNTLLGLSPRTSHEADIVFLARAVEGACATPGLLKAMREFIYRRTSELEGPIPVEEVSMLSQICDTPLPPGTAVRRKRADDGEPSSTEEAKRRCAAEPLIQRDPRLRRRVPTQPPPPTPVPFPQAQAQTPTTFAAVAATNAPPVSTAPPPPASAAPPQTPIVKQRYPPLVVETLPNWSTHFKNIKSRLGRAPNARPFGRGVRFSPSSEEEYRIIQRYLSELERTERISWFCYSLPQERNIKVAIRGLPADTPPEEILEELRELGFSPEYVRPIKARAGRPGCIFLAILERTATTIPGIYGVTELLCMPGVKIEAWRGKKGPAQCHKCQQFRHSSHNCHRPQKCVRCGEGHFARDCPRPRDQPPTCANCGGPHPANNTACPVFRKEAQNKRAGAVALTAKHPVVVDAAPAVPPGTGATLAAPANDPPPRGSSVSRRRRKRGKRSRPDDNQQKKPDTTLPVPAAPQSAVRPTGVANQKTLQLDTTIELLLEILKTIRAGQDPVPVILRGLANLHSNNG